MLARVAGLRQRLTESVSAFSHALGNPALRRLQLAAAGSVIGNWAYLVALVVYAYGVGGATGVAIAALVRNLPSAVAAPLTGVLGDRFSRLRVMIGSDLIRAAAML